MPHIAVAGPGHVPLNIDRLTAPRCQSEIRTDRLRMAKPAGMSINGSWASALIGPTPGMRMKRRHRSSWRTIAITTWCSRPYSCHNAVRARSMQSVREATSGSSATRLGEQTETRSCALLGKHPEGRNPRAAEARAEALAPEPAVVEAGEILCREVCDQYQTWLLEQRTLVMLRRPWS